MIRNTEITVGVWTLDKTVITACDHSCQVDVTLTFDDRISLVAAESITGINQMELESTLCKDKITRTEALKKYFSLRIPKIVTSSSGTTSVEFLGPFPIRKRIEEALSRGNKIIALIRHAERSQAEIKTMQQDLHLTQWGRNSSRLLGEKLKGLPIESIYTSPIDRCVDTCKEMILGFCPTIPISTSTVLGDPGPFTADCDLAGPIFQKTPLIDIIKNLAKGDHISGMRTITEGTRIFLDYALSREDKIAIMVSHDAIISWIALFFMEKKEVEEMIPNFLEGLYLEVNEEKKLIVHYKDLRFEISSQELQRRWNV